MITSSHSFNELKYYFKSTENRYILKDAQAPIGKLQDLSNELKKNKNIVNIDYSNQAFNSKDRLEKAFGFILERDYLHDLLLSKNDITDESFSHFTLLFKRTKGKFRINRLRLNENRFGETSLMLISELLNWVDIDHLDISLNPGITNPSTLFLNDSHHLKSLNISGFNLKGEDVSKLCYMLGRNTSLTSINLSNNKWIGENLSRISESILKADKITVLDLSNTTMSEKQFKIFCHQLGYFSSKKEGLKLHTLNLRNSKLSNKSFAYLSAALETNKKLHTLDISKTEVTPQFYSSLSKNSTLKILNVSETLMYNKHFSALLSSLEPTGSFSPEELNLSSSFSCFSINSIQEFLSLCLNNKKLKVLKLADSKLFEESKIRTISEYIAKNPNLTHLDLSGNKFPSHAHMILNVLKFNNNLKKLNLRGVGFQDEEKIRESLKDNYAIEKLYYACFKTIDRKYFKMDKQDNKLTLRDMDLRKHLFMTGDVNSISESQEIMLSYALEWNSRLEKLQEITLFNTQINDLMHPMVTENLINLSTLCLRKNNIFFVPQHIEHLVNLRKLDLSDNNLGCIGNISNMTNLEELNVNHNNIFVLIGGLGNLQRLRKMSARNNWLETLPASTTKLSNSLLEFDLTGNPLRMLPSNVTKFGDFHFKKDSRLMKSLFGYLSSINNNEKDLIIDNACKLMFVGDGGVGKTSLLNSLSNQKRPTETIATEGIDISTLVAKGTGKNKGLAVEFGCWDYAGQDIFYSSHNFFISSKKSIYLIMFNASVGDISKVHYWLNTIKIRAKDAPVVIVGTHKDKLKYSALKELQEKLRSELRSYKITYVAFVSSNTGDGIKKLRTELVDIAYENKLFGGKISKKWNELGTILVNLREENKILTAPRQSESRLSRISLCYPGFLEYAKGFDMDEMQAKSSLEYLHDSGYCLYYDEDLLSDSVFVDPQMVTRLLSTIITFSHNFVADGKLRYSVLKHIWPEYDPLYWETFLLILEKMEMIYPMKNDKSGQTIKKLELNKEKFVEEEKIVQDQVYLVPNLLPENQPHLEGWSSYVSDQEYEIGRVFQFQFLPLGFFAKLVIRVLYWNLDLVTAWRTGILVKLKTSKVSELALLTYNPASYTLRLRVRGSNDKLGNLLQYMVQSIVDLISGWFDTSYEMYIPCTHCVHETESRIDPFYFTVPQVVHAITEKKRLLYCKGLENRPVLISKLAPDLALADSAAHMIEYTDLEMGKLLGEGSFAKVYKGTYRGKTVAVKQLNNSSFDLSSSGSNSLSSRGSSSGISYSSGNKRGGSSFNLFTSSSSNLIDHEVLNSFTEFQREAWLMSALNSPYLVNLEGIVMDPLCLVMEFLPFGSLYQLVHDLEKYPVLEQSFINKIALNIARGMKVLHTSTPQIIHRDLKSPNVLICSDNKDDKVIAKVADFGLSRFGGDFSGREVWNPYWLAPEIIELKEYDEKVDVYSFGIMLWELMARTNPFSEFDREYKSGPVIKLEDDIVKGKRPTVPKDCPENIKALIEKCWDKDPKVRPSFDSIAETLAKITGDEEEEAEFEPTNLLSREIPNEPTPTTLEKLDEVIPPSPFNAQCKNKVGVQNTACKIVSDAENDSIWAGFTNGDVIGYTKHEMKEKTKYVHDCRQTVINMLIVEKNIWVSYGNNVVVVLSLSTGKKVSEIKVSAPVYAMALLHNEESSNKKDLSVFCSQVDGKLVCFHSNNFSVRWSDSTRFKSSSFVTALLLHGGNLWSGTSKGDIVIMSSKQPFEQLGSFSSIHLSLVSDLVSVNPLTVWSSSHDRRILVWTTRGDNIAKASELNVHSSKINCLVQTSQHIWSCSSDKSIFVWDKENRKVVKEISNAHDDSVLCGSNIGDLVYTGSASLCKTLRCWSVSEFVKDDLDKNDDDNFVSVDQRVLGIFGENTTGGNVEIKTF